MARRRLLAGITVLLPAIFAMQTLGRAEAGDGGDWSSLRDGRDVFEAACASCHGVRGTGVDRATRGFETDPPDFTDCKFTSREPKNDWVGVATEGGPLKGFDPMMPAFGEALTRAQLEAAVRHAKGFCPERHWPPGEFNLPKALNTGKAFPEDEVLWSLALEPERPAAVNAKLVVARRVGARHQLEAVLPGGLRQVESATGDGRVRRSWAEGAGDLAVAWKSVLWHDLAAGTIGSATLDVFLPTGDEADGFSDGRFAFEPALAMGQIFPGLGFVQLQGGAELSTDTEMAPHGVFWRGAVGRTFRRAGIGRAWSPMVELLGAKELTDGAKVEWDVVPQLQVALSQRQHIRLGAGTALPLTDAGERPWKVQTYVVWDWYDGGLGEGW